MKLIKEDILDDRETMVADMIAERFRCKDNLNRGLIISTMCKDYNVDQTRVARHLQNRRNRRRQSKSNTSKRLL